MAPSARGISTVIAMAILGVFAGCAGGPPVLPPTSVHVTGSVAAAGDVNPDSGGRASPLVVKIFQLRSTDKFASAGFFPLFDEAESALGADLIGIDEVTLAPGESVPYMAEFSPQARYVGVIGAYRDINQASWRSVLEMPEAGSAAAALMIKADRLGISVSAGP